jgi:trimeric autotransporter adhesin
MWTIHRSQIVAVLAAALLGCSGGSGYGSPTTPPTPVLTSILVAGGSTVAVGAALQVTASPRDQNGNAIAATVNWSSGATNIATVNGSGVVTGVAPGTAVITASSGSVSANTTVTVTAPLVLTSISVGGGASVVAGSTLQLTAAPVDQNGNAIAATITWSSGATGIATVSNAGLVTGVAAGTAVITAASGSVSATTTITVTAAASLRLTTITLSGGSSVVAGSTLQLTAAPKDQNGNAIAATITWASSATGVASVNSGGLVTGVAAGTANITATSGGVVGTAVITVTAASSYPLSANVDATIANSFTPASVDIASNGTVNWNFASTTHNVTFGSAGAPANIPNSSSTTVSRTFAVAGTFTYQCTIHAGMTAQVIVH